MLYIRSDRCVNIKYMNFESKEKQTSPEDEALKRISAIMNEVSQMGGNDYEMSALANIRDGVVARTKTPEAGITEAERIKDSKQRE